MGKHSSEKWEKVSDTLLSDPRLRSVAHQATSMTTRRRGIGAAAGGLLGMAFLPMTVAHADEWTITPDAHSVETSTGIYGMASIRGGDTVPPAAAGSIQGNQVFDWINITTPASSTVVRAIPTRAWVASAPTSTSPRCHPRTSA
jgi:hypothetical protein